MSDSIDPQQFGRMQAQVEQLLEADKSKTELLEKLFDKVEGIDKRMAEARGGWKALMFIGYI